MNPPPAKAAAPSNSPEYILLAFWLLRFLSDNGRSLFMSTFFIFFKYQIIFHE